MRLGDVLVPNDTDEVQRLVQAAHRYRATVGVGSKKTPNRLTVSLSSLTGVRDMDTISGLVTVEAGCVLADLESILADEGLALPAGHFANASDRLGVAISDGEGAPLIVSVGGVLPDGMVFHTPLAPRRATGANPDALLTGSGNRLAIPLWATLRTVPRRSVDTTLAFAGPAESIARQTRELLITDFPDAVATLRKGKTGRATVTWQIYNRDHGDRIQAHYDRAGLSSTPARSHKPSAGRPKRALWSQIVAAMQGSTGSGTGGGPLDAHGGWIRKAKRTHRPDDPLLARVVRALDPQDTLGGQSG